MASTNGMNIIQIKAHLSKMQKTTTYMFIIDEKGLMKYHWALDDAGGRGFMNKDLLKSNNYVKESLKKLQDGKTPSSPSTKPYGCSVKYAS